MKIQDVVDRMAERARPRRESFDAPLENRRPFLTPRRRRRHVLAAIGLLLLLAGASFLMGADRATVVPVDDVVRRFEADRGGAPSRGVDVGITDSVAAPMAETVIADRPFVRTEAAPQGAEPYTLPTEGVFEYKASGGERLSVFGAEHRYPERVYATVTHTDGCGWEARIDVIEEHTDIVRLCSGLGRLHQTSQTRDLTFFGVREVVTMSCDPLLVVHETVERAGAKQKFRCTDEEQTATADITRTLVGVEQMTIGGETTHALHVHLDTTMKGRATGTSTDDIWVSPDTGMLFRWKRLVDTETSAAFGVDARYIEDAEFVLSSLEPIS